MTVAELIDHLGVTATAVRQRIERMLESGLIDREKVSSGRGRPTYSYMLSDEGRRQAAADAGPLTEAMWRSIMSLPDAETRKWLLGQVAQRLGSQYGSQIEDGSLLQRMEDMTRLLGQKRVLAEVSSDGELPVIDVCACPYPDLTDDDSRREMCQLEEEMLSEALGQPIHLSRCQLDGHDCCQFAPAQETQTS